MLVEETCVVMKTWFDINIFSVAYYGNCCLCFIVCLCYFDLNHKLNNFWGGILSCFGLNLFSVNCVLVLQMISLLPEEWKPGETLFGCPWQAVAITALVGVLSFTLFFWRTVLAVSVVISLLLFLFKLLLL